MNPSDLLAEFAQRTGLQGAAFNEAGLARLRTGDWVVDLEHDSATGLLHLYTSLGVPHAGLIGATPVHTRLLAMNLFTKQTLGATLGLDVSNGEVLLSRALPTATTDYLAFEAALGDLVTAAEGVSAELATGGGQAMAMPMQSMSADALLQARASLPGLPPNAIRG